MKKGIKLIIFFFFLQFGSLYAQMGVQVFYAAPTADMRYILKPTFGIEGTFSVPVPDEDGHFLFTASVGIMKFSPTADTFHTVTYTNDPDRASIIPSHQIINSYVVIPISLGAEFKILNTELSPVIGLEGNFYTIIYSGQSYTPGVVSSNTVGENYWQTGITPKIGLSYLYNEEWLLTFSVGQTIGWKGTADKLTFTKTALRIAHLF